jgi:hypothetical protein
MPAISVSAFGVAKLAAPLEIEAFLARHRGFEAPVTLAPRVVNRRLDDAKETTKDDQRRGEVSASGDVVEVALARAIEAEVSSRDAGWEARVAALAAELRARRLARNGVAPYPAAADRPGEPAGFLTPRYRKRPTLARVVTRGMNSV